MNLRRLHGVDVAGKRVLVRVDFNVPMEHEHAKQKFRIRSAKQTVDYLIDNGAKVALMAHLGRPDGEVVDALSLRHIVNDIADILNHPIVFADHCVGDDIVNLVDATQDGAVVLLENVRFHFEEKSDDVSVRDQFAQKLAQGFDLYVNDAFSVCHRAHASVTNVAKILPSYAGMWLVQEVEVLHRVRTNPEHPAVFVVGGAKIETKLPLIHALEEVYDTILVGGRIANEAIDTNVKLRDNVVLPVDFAQNRYDIGAETITQFVKHMQGARTIVWNGPLGKYEEEEFAYGTRAIVEALASSPAFTVAGGGESIQVLEQHRLTDKINFVSTGGGAMLSFMSGNELPGISILAE